MAKYDFSHEEPAEYHYDQQNYEYSYDQKPLETQQAEITSPVESMPQKAKKQKVQSAKLSIILIIVFSVICSITFFVCTIFHLPSSVGRIGLFTELAGDLSLTFLAAVYLWATARSWREWKRKRAEFKEKYPAGRAPVKGDTQYRTYIKQKRETRKQIVSIVFSIIICFVLIAFGGYRSQNAFADFVSGPSTVSGYVCNVAKHRHRRSADSITLKICPVDSSKKVELEFYEHDFDTAKSLLQFKQRIITYYPHTRIFVSTD